MEIQVDFLGSDIDLEHVVIWFMFSHVGFRTGCKLFILKVMPIVYTLFETAALFVKSLHAYPFCFSIAKGLATCWLGGGGGCVISA